MHLHDGPPLGFTRTDIIEGETAIGTYAPEHRRFSEVEPHRGDRLSGRWESEVGDGGAPAGK